MKKQGAKSEFGDDRAVELIAAFRRATRCTQQVNLLQISQKLCRTRASRFWVSPERATWVVQRIMRMGEAALDGMRESKKRMFREIHRRAMSARAEQPDESMLRIVSDVLEEPAPEFYMEPLTAVDIIYKWTRRQAALRKAAAQQPAKRYA